MRDLIYAMLISVIILTFFACKPKQQETKETLRPVKYETIGFTSSKLIRAFSGVAKAANEIELSFRNGGIITNVNVITGQKVKKGELIARLDNVTAQLDYEKAISALNSSKSALDFAKNELERTKSLYEKGSKALSDYQTAKNNYQNAIAENEAAERNKSIQQKQIEFGYIYAPGSGIIARTTGKVNERVETGHVFAVLNAGKGIKIEVGLPENIINQVKVKMPVKISFSTIPNRIFEGLVYEVSPIQTENAVTYPVDIELISADTDIIKPGMTANVTFDLSDSKNDQDSALIIPLYAIGEDSKGNFVFTIDSEDGIVGHVKKQHINLGELTIDGFKIKDGIKEGQLVATAGLQTLLDGQKVKLK